MPQLQRPFRTTSRSGSTAVEYAVVLGLIVIACIGTLQVLGQNTEQVFRRIATGLNQGTSSPVPSGGVGSGGGKPPGSSI